MPRFSSSLRQVGPYLNLGAMLAACVAIGVGLGYGLDEKLGTHPWLLLAGSALGIGSGFYHFFKTINQQLRKADKGDES
ncbi:MAG: AtpZ/AtpI family protein [Deltaproteobacteria bacterium]|nr:AtpZ/AtpI family protein [Deltaproteobacteria bacterium]